jgi:predicted dehydrogenase
MSRLDNRKNPLKLGLIGCGRVTESRHLPALQHVSEAEVVGLADVDTDRLNLLADRFRIKSRYPNFVHLLQDPSIEVVGICVPAQFHVEIALAALEAGKHLFIEKPLALSLEETDQLIAQAEQSSRKVMVGFNMRWHRLVREAREIIQQGTLGALQMIRSVLTSYHENVPAWRSRRESGGGALFEIAVHHFDLWCYLLHSQVQEIFAVSRSGQWQDEVTTVSARMANGVLVSSLFSERTSESHEVEVYGRAGRLRLSCHEFDGLEYFSYSDFAGDPCSRLRKFAHTMKELPQAIRGMRRGGDFIASYENEWRHLIDAVRNDLSVECSLEDGRLALEVVLAAVLSASRRQPVTIRKSSGNHSNVPQHGAEFVHDFDKHA